MANAATTLQTLVESMGMFRYQLAFSRAQRSNISLTAGRLQSLYEITRPNLSFLRARIDGSAQARLATSLKNMRIFSILTAVALGLLLGPCSSQDQGSQLNSQAQVALSIAAEEIPFSEFVLGGHGTPSYTRQHAQISCIVSSSQQQSLQQLRDLATKLERPRPVFPATKLKQRG